MSKRLGQQYLDSKLYNRYLQRKHSWLSAQSISYEPICFKTVPQSPECQKKMSVITIIFIEPNFSTEVLFIILHIVSTILFESLFCCKIKFLLTFDVQANVQNNTHIIPSYNDLCALLLLENIPDLMMKKNCCWGCAWSWKASSI